jgi:hypothetical protein
MISSYTASGVVRSFVTRELTVPKDGTSDEWCCNDGIEIIFEPEGGQRAVSAL